MYVLFASEVATHSYSWQVVTGSLRQLGDHTYLPDRRLGETRKVLGDS